MKIDINGLSLTPNLCEILGKYMLSNELSKRSLSEISGVEIVKVSNLRMGRPVSLDDAIKIYDSLGRPDELKFLEKASSYTEIWTSCQKLIETYINSPQNIREKIYLELEKLIEL